MIIVGGETGEVDFTQLALIWCLDLETWQWSSVTGYSDTIYLQTLVLAHCNPLSRRLSVTCASTESVIPLINPRTHTSTLLLLHPRTLMHYPTLQMLNPTF